ncbi:MAG: hypothetical protein Q8Q90_01500, partial [bacterium]|nr:hypothetical protein [bacterium]
HYFLFTAVFIGFLFVLNWYAKGFKVNFKNFLILGGVFMLILIPYLINYITFNSLDSAADYSFRLGKESGRFLVWDYLKNPANTSIVSNHLIYLVTLVLVYLFYFKRNAQDRKHKGIFFMGLVLTMFFVWHIPLFLGFGFALMHFNKPINIAIFIIYFDLIWLIINQIKNKFVFLHKIVIITFITLAVSLVSKHFINTFIFLDPPKDQLEAYTFPKEVKTSWQWINSNVSGEPKVVSNSLVTSLYLASYTSSRPYLATGFLSTLPTSELENRFYVTNNLFQVPENTIIKRFDGGFSGCLESSCFKDSGLNWDFGKTRWYLASAAWLNTGFSKDPENTLKEYKNMEVDWPQTNSDYVYYGPWEKEFSQTNFSGDSNLELIYKNPSVEIYKINNDTL